MSKIDSMAKVIELVSIGYLTSHPDDVPVKKILKNLESKKYKYVTLDGHDDGCLNYNWYTAKKAKKDLDDDGNDAVHVGGGYGTYIHTDSAKYFDDVGIVITDEGLAFILPDTY